MFWAHNTKGITFFLIHNKKEKINRMKLRRSRWDSKIKTHKIISLSLRKELEPQRIALLFYNNCILIPCVFYTYICKIRNSFKILSFGNLRTTVFFKNILVNEKIHTEDVLYYMKFIYLLELTAVKNSVSKPGNEFSDACIFRAFFPPPLNILVVAFVLY